MDIYRLIKICGILVALWVIHVVAFGIFRSGVAAKTPRYNVVDIEKEFSQSHDARPIVEIAKERGWDASAPFVSAGGAKELEREYEHKRWIAFAALAIALISASALVFTGYRIWDSWLLGLAVVIFGPFAIAWGMSRIKSED